jgi:hypothetical protein
MNFSRDQSRLDRMGPDQALREDPSFLALRCCLSIIEVAEQPFPVDSPERFEQGLVR